MPLTSEEFAHLDKARIVEMAVPVRKQKTMLRLAFEHITQMQEQQQKLLFVAKSFAAQRDASMCHRLRAFFKRLGARARNWAERQRKPL